MTSLMEVLFSFICWILVFFLYFGAVGVNFIRQTRTIESWEIRKV